MNEPSIDEVVLGCRRAGCGDPGNFYMDTWLISENTHAIHLIPLFRPIRIPYLPGICRRLILSPSPNNRSHPSHCYGPLASITLGTRPCLAIIFPLPNDPTSFFLLSFAFLFLRPPARYFLTVTDGSRSSPLKGKKNVALMGSPLE
jgi:hypothetical protein